METQAQTCRACNASLNNPVNFCPQCGARVSLQSPAMRFTPSHLAIVGLSAAAIFSFGWFMQAQLAGPRPTRQMAAKIEAPSSDVALSAELKELRQKAEGDAKNVSLWVVYAERLVSQIRANPTPSQELIFEAIDVLRKILDLDEKNAFALIAMADISFEQQAFSKAAEFYREYLEIESEDVGARARLASTLSFLGQYPEALEELRVAGQKDPDSFAVRAYTAVVYAQMGEKDKAREKGREALEIAPNDEARARFSEFITKLDEPPAPDTIQADADHLPLTPGAQSIVDALKSNPVAGPKYVRAEIKDGELLVFFRDFPMEQMPPFAKEKFFNGIKQSASQIKPNEIRIIIFADSENGSELARLSVR